MGCVQTESERDFSKLTKPQIFFVLGGPGSGKGTQCENLVRDYKFKHLSIGDLLRQQKARGGPQAKMLDDLIKQGKLVPSELVVKLMRKNLGRHGNRRYLIDGFPRNIENWDTFKKILRDEVVVKNLIFFDCSSKVMTERIMQRGKTSGRADDNVQSIKLRLQTYENQTLPVVAKFKDAGNCISVNAQKSKQEVYKQLKQQLDEAGIYPPDPAEILFVLGGPGSGKGTQCEILVKQYGFKHLSTGDLLRQSVKNGTKAGVQIEACMKQGKLVSSQLLVALIEQKLQRYNFGGRYLLDGFPRGQENIDVWNRLLSKWVQLKGVLYFKCNQEQMTKRLLERGKTSGRADDNVETIKKRFQVFNTQTAPVIANYQKEQKVLQINAMQTIEQVAKQIKEKLTQVGINQKKVNEDGPKIVLVLGGPGSGKGTQCERLKTNFGFKHLSTGDLLREEEANDGLNADLIREYIKDGKLVPSEILVHLIRKAIEKNGNEGFFLLDGFPRNQQNIDKWNQIVGIQLDFENMIYFECSQKVMQERLINRGKSSGRADDNTETIKKRFTVFVEQTKPIITKMQKQQGFVITVNAERSADEVFDDLKKKMIEEGYKTV